MNELIKKYDIPIYFGLFRKIDDRKRRKIFYIILAPVLLIYGLLCFIYENTIDRIFVHRELKTFISKKYKYDLAFVACILNEARYIEEWIEYHRLVGVDKFYIFDNGSTDNTKEILQKYIDEGIVDLEYFPGKGKQLDMYYKGLRKCRKDAKYVGFIDLDEFVVPTDETKSLVEVLDERFSHFSGMAALSINWLVFGSSGHKTRPEGLVIENYLNRAEYDSKTNRLLKFIANPRLIKGCITSPHFAYLRNGSLKQLNEKGIEIDSPWNDYPNNTYDHIRINHYYGKSEEDCKAKFNRGNVSRPDYIKRKWDQFVLYDRNEVHDERMLLYCDRVRQSLEGSMSNEKIV
ncbi:glycosyltransferase family 92 protein [Butyrivibrio sp.]|uniref:glycosyltransferase family 92 protein n=1 Tax=Butyrivibrio sp. TaxID=28121 RepID=UPI0025C44B5A|nr:glycosyltransferase family 92 protein [Butyrivibrio sp.]MBQ9304363.1 glycosyltransferase family 92 protein [Butyrivibrio sp.]